LRGIGALQKEGLKFGVIRCGAPYGPGVCDGEVVARLVVGHVYKHLYVQLVWPRVLADEIGKRK
jgi:hypothetical protein